MQSIPFLEISAGNIIELIIDDGAWNCAVSSSAIWALGLFDRIDIVSDP